MFRLWCNEMNLGHRTWNIRYFSYRLTSIYTETNACQNSGCSESWGLFTYQGRIHLNFRRQLPIDYIVWLLNINLLCFRLLYEVFSHFQSSFINQIAFELREFQRNSFWFEFYYIIIIIFAVLCSTHRTNVTSLKSLI